jgi:hypothetical protein
LFSPNIFFLKSTSIFGSNYFARTPRTFFANIH